MEPLRGGALAKLNDEARAIFKRADAKASPASWAFRYAADLPNVLCILSGMTEMEHLNDNINTFSSLKPLSSKERGVIAGALAAYLKRGTVPCTDCRYCLPCPAGVAIPKVFAMYNKAKLNSDFETFNKEYASLTEEERAQECVSCMACVRKCPQSIDIPKELKRIVKETTTLGKNS
jgi:predicted aldo/keto reductase-like oxidoreductase